MFTSAGGQGVVCFRARRDAEKAFKLAKTYQGKNMQLKWRHTVAKAAPSSPAAAVGGLTAVASPAANAEDDDD